MAPPNTRSFNSSGSASRINMPPGAIRSTSYASSSVANNYTRITLEALINAPARKSQPHLHPHKLDNALWFGIDDSVYKFVRTTWQGNYMGPWRSWKFVPEEKKDIWWQAFVQNYYWDPKLDDIVYNLWKTHTQETICQKISKKKRENKKPWYMDDNHWTELLEYWATEPAIKKSKLAAKSRMSDPDGKGMHKHSAGPRNFSKIEYDMMVKSGSSEPPPYTDLARETHTRKNKTFVDARAESIILEVEETIKQLTAENRSPNGTSHTVSTGATRNLINQEYIKRGQSKRGRIYGIGSVQFRELEPKESIPASLQRNLDIDMRLTGLETHTETVNNNVETLKTDMMTLKEDVVAFKTEFKEEMSATRSALNMILQTLQQTSQPAVIPPVPATFVNPTPTVPSTTSTPPLTKDHQSDLDRWCASLL